MRSILNTVALSLFFTVSLFTKASEAYPVYAQQNYENPREATGKIVCANCHLANMKTQAEVPQSVAADSVFKTVVEIPYKNGTQEITVEMDRVLELLEDAVAQAGEEFAIKY